MTDRRGERTETGSPPGPASGRGSGEGTPRRKPYSPPAVTFQEKLELFAAVCVPGKADPITCPSGPISS